jgi:hypothetical protein
LPGAPTDYHTVLTDQLVSYGVWFSTIDPEGVFWWGPTYPWEPARYSIHAGGLGGEQGTDPIRVDFSPYVVEASIRGFNGGGDVDTLILRAFDSNDNLVDSSTITDVFSTPGLVASVSAPEIAYITFEVSVPTDHGLFFDDLSYEVPELTLEVAVDIKPGSCPNPLNVKSKGVLPVAILGTEDFDVNQIDIASIRLEGVAPIRSSYEDVATPVADGTGEATAMASEEDPPCTNGDCPDDPPCTNGDCPDDPPCTNGECPPTPDGNECQCTTAGPDGYTDLTLKFKTQEIVEVLGNVNDGEVLSLTLTGSLSDETPIEGEDCVSIVGRFKPFSKGDLNKDGIVNLLDMAIITKSWLESSIVED